LSFLFVTFVLTFSFLISFFFFLLIYFRLTFFLSYEFSFLFLISSIFLSCFHSITLFLRVFLPSFCLSFFSICFFPPFVFIFLSCLLPSSFLSPYLFLSSLPSSLLNAFLSPPLWGWPSSWQHLHLTLDLPHIDVFSHASR
jgi:hypothetical protein